MNASSKKTALVTGASSGIGQATAEALARAGFTVFGTSRKPPSIDMQRKLAQRDGRRLGDRCRRLPMHEEAIEQAVEVIKAG